MPSKTSSGCLFAFFNQNKARCPSFVSQRKLTRAVGVVAQRFTRRTILKAVVPSSFIEQRNSLLATLLLLFLPACIHGVSSTASWAAVFFLCGAPERVWPGITASA